MAATCSHILTNASGPSESRVPSHSRDVSTISSTLHTNTTVHSQPTEPLLRPTTPEARQIRDVPSHRSRSSDRSLRLPQWSQSHVMSSHAAPIVSEKGSKAPLKRVKLLRWIKNGLAVVMGKHICILSYPCLRLETIRSYSMPQYHLSVPYILICRLSNLANDCHI